MIARITPVFGALALLVLPASDAAADPNQRACGAFVGSYLTTNRDTDGSIDSRSVITFWADGNFLFVDSNQAGVPGQFNPFTDSSGTWRCRPGPGPEKRAEMVTLDFTLPGSEGQTQQIARLDFFDVRLSKNGQEIQGAATLRFFPFDGDPFGPTSNTAEPFFFDGRRMGQPQPPGE